MSSHPNQPHTHYQSSSHQASPQNQPPHYPSNGYQDPKARDHMNPQGHNPTNNYPDPRLGGYPQQPPIQPTAMHQPQQQCQQDYGRQSHQVLYIPTPPLVAPGDFQNPNPPPFTTTPRNAVQTTSPPTVRYQCSKCGNTFSRLHDRKRHYESTHSDNRPIHECEGCRKRFSRADAKKRHQGDGKCVSSP